MAQTLRITQVEALADNRLDAPFDDRITKRTQLEKVLTSLSKTGVKFEAASELRSKDVSLNAGCNTLRACMSSLSDELEAVWEKRGDGYFLVPFDPNQSPKKKDGNKP